MKILSAAAILLLLPGLSLAAENMEEISRDKILGAGAEWQEKYDKFQAAQDLLDALKSKVGANLKVDVYLGLWCPDSRNNVPPFVRILERLGGEIPIRYFNLQRKASRETQYYVEALKVERVPTFIFYRDGREIGRIIENPKASLAEDFMEILFSEK